MTEKLYFRVGEFENVRAKTNFLLDLLGVEVNAAEDLDANIHVSKDALEDELQEVEEQ
jgi:hypothetical protein